MVGATRAPKRQKRTLLRNPYRREQGVAEALKRFFMRFERLSLLPSLSPCTFSLHFQAALRPRLASLFITIPMTTKQNMKSYCSLSKDADPPLFSLNIYKKNNSLLSMKTWPYYYHLLLPPPSRHPSLLNACSCLLIPAPRSNSLEAAASVTRPFARARPCSSCLSSSCTPPSLPLPPSSSIASCCTIVSVEGAVLVVGVLLLLLLLLLLGRGLRVGLGTEGSSMSSSVGGSSPGWASASSSSVGWARRVYWILLGPP
jgi:hypothetical protein